MNKTILYFIRILLLVLSFTFMVGCSKEVPKKEETSNLLNYEFNISDLKNINKILSEQKFAYSSESDKKYIAVINYQSNKASVKQYLIDKDTALDIPILKGSKIIISLPENNTDDYVWDVKSTSNSEVIKFDSVSPISVPVPNSEKKIAYTRKNFFLKTEGVGNGEIVMRYAQLPDKKPPYDVQRNEKLKVTFNIKVE